MHLNLKLLKNLYLKIIVPPSLYSLTDSMLGLGASLIGKTSQYFKLACSKRSGITAFSVLYSFLILQITLNEFFCLSINLSIHTLTVLKNISKEQT